MRTYLMLTFTVQQFPCRASFFLPIEGRNPYFPCYPRSPKTTGDFGMIRLAFPSLIRKRSGRNELSDGHRQRSRAFLA